MIRTFTIAAALLGAIALVQAQAPTGQPPADRPAVQPPAAPQPPQQRPTESSDKTDKVTVTGCLKPGTAAGTWALENVQMAPAAEAGAQAKPAETPKGTVGAAGAKKTYNLIVKAGEDPKAHTNHKIEVTGTVSQAGSTPGATAGAAAQQTFTVDSLKMVSATCP